MIIARDKKKNNIIEYILYMWQIEDMIRSYEFDLSQISKDVIEKFDASDSQKGEMKMWYKNLIDDMMKEGIPEKGHLSFIKIHIDELNNLHNSLLTTLQDEDYQNAYFAAKENINDFLKKSGKESMNEIEACLVGLYGYLMLRLKKDEIGKATQEAINSFSKLLAVLANRYNKLTKGELDFPKEKSN